MRKSNQSIVLVRSLRFTINFILSSFSLVGFGDAQKIQTINSASRTDSLLKQCVYFFGVDDKKSFKLAKEAFVTAKQNKDSVRMAYSGWLMGENLRIHERIDSATLILDEVIPIARESNSMKDYKRILNSLAVCYTYSSNYVKALEYHFLSLEIREKEFNLKEMGIAYTNIGLVYYKLQNFEKAIFYYNKAISSKLNSDCYFLDNTYINIALCYLKKKEYSECKKSIELAYLACNGTCNDRILMQGDFCIGIYYSEKGNNSLSLKHFNESLFIALALPDFRYQAETFVQLGSISLKKGELDEAYKLLINAKTIATDKGYNELLLDVYRGIAEIEGLKGNWKTAAKYQLQFINLNDSLFNKIFVKNLAQIQSEYEERENRLLIANQEKHLQLNEAKIERQTIVIISSGLIAILLTGLAVLLFRILKYRKQISRDLDDRVRIRTNEMINNKVEIRRLISEAHFFKMSIVRNLISLHATITGLGTVAQKEGTGILKEYGRHINCLGCQTEQLISLVKRSAQGQDNP